MRKFIFNKGIISALFGGWSIFKATQRGPRDWRLVLMWISWALSFFIAVGTVVIEKNEHSGKKKRLHGSK